MNKRQYLQGLKEEVSELHPLLLSLFPKMQGVTNVRYNHGQLELGADFILERKESFLGNTIHTGVIVKAGNISSAYQKIIEQIKECKVSRLDIDGQRITINDVMFVTNGNITPKTRMQMESEAVSTFVQIVDIDKLLALLNQYLGDTWTSNKVLSSVYLRDLLASLEENDKRLNLISTMEDIYIEPTVVEKAYDFQNTNTEKEHKINLFERVGKDKFILIDGGFGIGKSKLLRRLAIRVCKENISSVESIPVLVSFDNLIKAHSGSVKELLKSKIPADVRGELSHDVKFIVFIDAIDEVKISDAEKSKYLNAIRDEIRSSQIFLVSSSRNARGLIKKNSELSLDCKIYDLKPITTTALINYVMRACSDVSLPQRIFADIKKSDLLKNLPKTPIAAILLARILKENPRDLPATLTELYSQFTEIVLGRWDIDKGLKRQIEYETQDRCLEDIAKFMIENGLPTISREEALGFFERYLGRRNLPVTALYLFDEMVERSGIVVLDNSTGCFSFKHKSLMEFFYAKEESHRKSLTLDHRAYTIFWQNVFFFYFGLLKDCEPELDQLNAIVPVDYPERFMRLMFLPSYLLAAYQTPYETITKILCSVANEFGDVYIGMRDLPGNPLGGMSEMHFLWFYQMIIKSEYAYSFFEKAFDDMQLKISYSDNDDSKPYSHFCLSAIKLELGHDDPFKLMMEHRDKLPLQAQLAIFYETKNMENPSELSIRYIRKMENQLKKGLVSKEAKKILFEKPLRWISEHKTKENKKKSE